MLDAQLSFLGDDGLTYCPTDTLAELIEQRPFSEVWGEGRLLLALSMLAQVDDDPRWAEAAKRKVDRFLELSRHKDGFRFLWKGRYSPGDNPPADADEPSKPREGGSLADYDPFFSIIYSTGALGHGSASCTVSRATSRRWSCRRAWRSGPWRGYSLARTGGGAFTISTTASTP